jgi:glycosyltransferase involved in cell wall biosynthesis
VTSDDATTKSPGGRPLRVVGDASLVTLERFRFIGERFDSDPRIASVSLVAHPSSDGTFIRATAPAGVVVVVADDSGQLVDLTAEIESLTEWAQAASERGLWHDWLLTSDANIRRADLLVKPATMDAEELLDPSGSHSRAFEPPSPSGPMTIAIDVTWLGPHETGAQVLTTAAIRALARSERVDGIELFGLSELPDYASHVLADPKVLMADDDSITTADIVWFPNQIDQRSDIADVRRRGRRIITTYLDLIAYDIPRYHASHDAWAAYRLLQRRIALTVDGITTISADVAKRLYQEVPRLETDRILPVPLGLDHISHQHVPSQPPEDVASLANTTRPFLLVLGNDFQHKNRDFAIKVWQRILDEGTSCDLVLAGLHVKGSSSKDHENQLLLSHVNLRGQVHTFGHVSHDARAWLLANAAAVLYPSSAEGFGFVPYEAAAMGVPSTFTRFGPLAELTGVRNTPNTWSVEEFARDTALLLADADHRGQRVRTLQQAITSQTWDLFASSLLDFFAKISSMPPTQASTIGAESTKDSAALAAILSSKTWRVASRFRRLGRMS